MKIETLKKMPTIYNLTVEKPKLLAHIFLLGMCALIQYSL